MGVGSLNGPEGHLQLVLLVVVLAYEGEDAVEHAVVERGVQEGRRQFEGQEQFSHIEVIVGGVLTDVLVGQGLEE